MTTIYIYIYYIRTPTRLHYSARLRARVMTNLKNKASEQYIELVSSRCSRDFQDLVMIQEWFDQHEPFDTSEGRLRSLSSGLTATDSDGINTDKTEEVGMKIQM